MKSYQPFVVTVTAATAVIVAVTVFTAVNAKASAKAVGIHCGDIVKY